MTDGASPDIEEHEIHTGNRSRGAPQTHTRARLPTGGLTSLSWRRYPTLSLHALLIDAMGGGAYSHPSLLRHLRSQLRPADRQTLAPLAVGMRHVTFPAFTVPAVDDANDWVDEASSRVGDTSPDALLTALETANVPFGERWRPVADQPERWLKDTALVMRRIGRSVEEVWRRAMPRLDIEQARFDLAVEAASQMDFVNTLSPSVRLSPTHLTLAFGVSLEYDVPGNLVVSPIIAGPGAHLLLTRPGELHLGYPTTAAMAGPPAPRRKGRARLASLLGEARATVLLTLSPRAATLGQLASRLNWAPSTVSHHVGLLERADLDWSLRLGKQRWIARTRTGEQLVELFSS